LNSVTCQHKLREILYPVGCQAVQNPQYRQAHRIGQAVWGLLTMTAPNLRPDCARCDALCCVLLAFDASEAFATSKPACEACQHLATDNACTIHADLSGSGYDGCVAFDCHGAGQRLTSQVFKGRSWRDDPSLMPAMDDAFRTLRRLHEALVLLQHFAARPQTAAQHATRQSLWDRLAADRTEDELQGPEPQSALQAARAYFAELR
jgi:hypothetical protein